MFAYTLFMYLGIVKHTEAFCCNDLSVCVTLNDNSNYFWTVIT